jgi:hypothetical protein
LSVINQRPKLSAFWNQRLICLALVNPNPAYVCDLPRLRVSCLKRITTLQQIQPGLPQGLSICFGTACYLGSQCGSYARCYY